VNDEPFEQEECVDYTVDGMDGAPAQENFSIKVTGILKARPDLADNRRFVAPTDH
jgi:hypothetical protein